LILRGQLPASIKRLAKKVHAEKSTVRLSVFRDKYAVPAPEVDCASRIPLCKARCCSFEVALSPQDIREGGVPFDIAHPYLLPRTEEGRCVCMSTEGACTIYEKRPGPCRAYDCRRDPRVWIDFDARIPAPHGEK
jgi:hypothetical protein